MLLKKNRANTTEIEKIFKQGASVSSPNISFRYLFIPTQKISKISFIAPKSIAKLSVERNLLRRLGYSVLKKHFQDFPSGILGALVFKRAQKDVLIIEHEIKDIIRKIH